MKRISLQLSGIFAIAALLLAGCASVAHVEKDDTADFSRYKTFYWMDKDAVTKKENSKANDIVEQKVRIAVNKELEKEGWRESKNNPDILLSYDVLVEKNIKQKNDAVYSRPFYRTFYNPYSRRAVNVYYPSQFAGYDNYDLPVKEGTLTITMTDTDTDKMVWQGWTTDEVNNVNLTTKEIQSSVKSIFRKFDVARK